MSSVMGADGEVEQTPKAKIPNGAVLLEPAWFNKHSQIADYGGGSEDAALHESLLRLLLQL